VSRRRRDRLTRWILRLQVAGRPSQLTADPFRPAARERSHRGATSVGVRDALPLAPDDVALHAARQDHSARHRPGFRALDGPSPTVAASSMSSGSQLPKLEGHPAVGRLEPKGGRAQPRAGRCAHEASHSRRAPRVHWRGQRVGPFARVRGRGRRASARRRTTTSSAGPVAAVGRPCHDADAVTSRITT